MLLAALILFATRAAVEAKSFIAISTPDADRASEWYRRHLDLRVVTEIRRQQPSDQVEVLILDGALATVELLEHREAAQASPRGDAWLRHGIFKAGLVVDDLERWLERWRREGVTVSAHFCWEGRPMAVIADGEGNNLQVLQTDAARPGATVCAQSPD